MIYRKNIRSTLIIIFLSFILFISCQKNDNKYVDVKGVGIKNEWVPYIRTYYKKKLIYEYYYQDSIYKDSIVMGATDPTYNVGDSLFIRIKKNKPHKPQIKEIFYRKNIKKTEFGYDISDTKEKQVKEEIVIIKKNEYKSMGYSYHLLDHKPTFCSSSFPEKNDSLVCDYIKKKCKNDNRPYIIGTDITIKINEEGKIEETLKPNRLEPYSEFEKEYFEYLTKILLEMPEWSPGIKNGQTVKVVYLIVL
jgi:hypothetical protein